MLFAVLCLRINHARAPFVPRVAVNENSNMDIATAKTMITEPGFLFTFGGDMMFGRSINYYFQGDKLAEVMSEFDESVFTNKDLSMVNLEGPISKNPFLPDNTPNNLVFNFPAKTAEVLQSLGINVVSLANNHTDNQGNTGVVSTKELLSNVSITPIGSQIGFNENSIARFTKGNTKVAVFAIDILATNTDLTDKISAEKSAGNFIIIFPHWGTEYEGTHSLSQEKLAHDWIDAGADLIVGSHPHVMQDAEVYKNRPVFYSMGNLLFDQTFSGETQRGLVISGDIEGSKLNIFLYPTVSRKLKPALLQGSERDQIVQKYFSQLGQEDKIEQGYLEFNLE